MDNYTRSVSVKTSKELVFAALTTQIDQWWGQVDQTPFGKGDVFTVSWGDPWYQFRIVEYQQFSAITWECIDANQLIDGLTGVEKEWVGTKLRWQIEQKAKDQVLVNFIHEGLVPEVTCYSFCASVWDQVIIERLKTFLENEEMK